MTLAIQRRRILVFPALLSSLLNCLLWSFASPSSQISIQLDRKQRSMKMQQEIDLMKEESFERRQQLWRINELPQLCLAPSPRHVVEKSANSSSSESETNCPSKKRKFSDHLLNKREPAMIQTSVDLQLKDPLPLDWEQCLDLESGRMYYLNRKTLIKSWTWPKDHNQQKLDLELNITLPDCPEKCSSFDSQRLHHHYKKHQHSPSSSSNMVALACLNCHLLVILSRSSPSCPNCKYVHSLPSPKTPTPPIHSLDTLSLLN